MVVPPLAMVGTCTEKLNGNDGSLATTLPFTSSSTLRICTLLATVGCTWMTEPSTTCTPGVFGSASIALVLIETVGGMPVVSRPI